MTDSLRTDHSRVADVRFVQFEVKIDQSFVEFEVKIYRSHKTDVFRGFQQLLYIDSNMLTRSSKRIFNPMAK